MKIQINQVIGPETTDRQKEWIIEKMETAMKDRLWEIMKGYVKYETWGDTIRLSIQADHEIERGVKYRGMEGGVENVEVLKFYKP